MSEVGTADCGVVIEDDRLYDLPWLKRNGFGTQALRTLRRKHGLKVYRAGRKSWVDGCDLRAAIKASSIVVTG